MALLDDTVGTKEALFECYKNRFAIEGHFSVVDGSCTVTLQDTGQAEHSSDSELSRRGLQALRSARTLGQLLTCVGICWPTMVFLLTHSNNAGNTRITLLNRSAPMDLT